MLQMDTSEKGGSPTLRGDGDSSWAWEDPLRVRHPGLGTLSFSMVLELVLKRIQYQFLLNLGGTV